MSRALAVVTVTDFGAHANHQPSMTYLLKIKIWMKTALSHQGNYRYVPPSSSRQVQVCIHRHTSGTLDSNHIPQQECNKSHCGQNPHISSLAALWLPGFLSESLGELGHPRVHPPPPHHPLITSSKTFYTSSLPPPQSHLTV